MKLSALTLSDVPEGVRGDELGPAVDDVQVALLAALGHRGQELLELLVDDPNTNLLRTEFSLTE